MMDKGFGANEAQLRARVQETALMQYVRVLAGEEGIELPGIEAAASPLIQ